MVNAQSPIVSRAFMATILQRSLFGTDSRELFDQVLIVLVMSACWLRDNTKEVWFSEL